MANISNVRMSKAEVAGARKVVGALKRSKLLPKGVRLEFDAPKTNPTYASFMRQGRKRKKKANPSRRTTVIARRARTVMVNGRKPARRRNVGGFMDAEGRFHPIRSGEREITYGGQRVLVKDDVPYSRRRAHEKAKKAKARPRKRNGQFATLSRRRSTRRR